MTQEVAAFFARTREAFLAGDLPSLVDQHAYPLPVYKETGLSLKLSAADIEAQVYAIREAALTLGLTDLSFALEAIAETTPDRATAVVHWRFARPEGRTWRDSRVRYYLQGRGTDRRIVMIEYIAPAFPLAI